MPTIHYKQLVEAAKKASGSKASPSASDVANYFLFVGTDLKGQNQSCYQALGFGLNAQVSFDPLKLHTAGVFSSSLEIQGEGQVLNKTLLVVQVGPSLIGPYTIETPLMLNFCFGRKFVGKLQSEFFVGIDFDTNSEGTGQSASLNVGAHLHGGISGDYFYGVNVQPLPFALGDSDLRPTLETMLRTRDYKEFLKVPAVEFINKVTNAGITLKKTGALASVARAIRGSSNVETDKLTSQLDIIARDEPQQQLRIRAASLAKSLRDYKEDVRPAINTSVSIFSGEVVGHGKITADANVTANLAGMVEIDLTSENKLLDINASTKPVYIRYQSAYPVMSRPSITNPNPASRYVAMTQDTTILYKAYDFTLASTNTSAAMSINSSEVAKKTLERSTEKASENRMTYVTTTIYWSSEVNINSYFSAGKITKNKSSVGRQDLVALPGSGISFGCSFPLKELKTAIDWSFSYSTEEDEMEEYEYFATHFYDIETYRESKSTETVLAHPELQDKVVNEGLVFEKFISAALSNYDEWLKEANKKAIIKHTPPKASMILKKMIQDGEVNDLKAALVWLLDTSKTAKDDPKFHSLFGNRLLKRDLYHRALAKTIGPTLNKSTFTAKLDEGYTNAFNAFLQEQKALKLKQEATNEIVTVTKTKVITQESRETKERGQRAIKVEKTINLDHKSPQLKAFFMGAADNPTLEQLIAPKRAYLQYVADQLRTDFGQIYDFFCETLARDLISAYEEIPELRSVDAIILESGFLIGEAYNSIAVIDRIVSNGSIDQELIELEADTSKKMLSRFERSTDKSLNVIRMRFRLQDANSNEKNLFKIGAKLLGNGARIQLKKVEEAGSEGIIDLCTSWYGFLLDSQTEAYKYNAGVPAVALFCQ